MKQIWRKILSTNKTNQTSNILSTHLPIYKIEKIASSNNHKYSIPQILFSSIAESIDCILLGESTHGTKEFYELRSIITKQLILNKGFTAIFIELDWPQAYILNQYVVGTINCDIDYAFNQITEYPLWMYRNSIIKELVFWLKTFNQKLKNNDKQMINIYGIDMQSYDSLNKLISLYKNQSNAAFLPNASEIVSLLSLVDINSKTFAVDQINNSYNLFLSTKDHIIKENEDNREIVDVIYNIDQHFITLESAIKYYSNNCEWDIRDNHWLNSIDKYFNYNKNGKIILWAHNSHCAHADYTNYSHKNIGSFLKNKYGQNKIFTVCFDTFNGNVTATNDRGELAQFFNLNDNVKQSYGALWHEIANYINCNEFVIFLENRMNKLHKLNDIQKEQPIYLVSISDVNKKNKIRDIGVCYENINPLSHCSNADILQLSDLLIFVDQSNALEPFNEDKHKSWDKNKYLWQKNHSKL